MDLRKGDLTDLIDKIVEIDNYKSKMGSDQDIITLAFSAKTKDAAEDLSKFIEAGYPFVLDADRTAGELDSGDHKVFVELERNNDACDNIMEIMYGVKIICDSDFKFRYYKNFKSLDFSEENLKNNVPTDRDAYKRAVEQNKLDNYKTFFSRSFLDSINLDGDDLIIEKKYADPLRFRILDFVDKGDLVVTESFNVNAYPEILFLTKYIGDYNISKYGENIFFENSGKTLITRRL